MTKLRTILAVKKVMLAMIFLVTGLLYLSNNMISARAVYSFEDEALDSKAPSLSNISGSHLCGRSRMQMVISKSSIRT